ncbi:MAG: HigA family addiction module antidote protein [Deltaproteobacteria bacterium]|nr:HigA family addiction module antidote protein [Deltaproteobacteria bacterium]
MRTTWRSWITTDTVRRANRKNKKEAVVPKKLLDPITPGEILLEEFMKPLGVSINKLARDIDVPPGRISEIVNGKRGVTADTALRLGRYFGVSPEIWLNLQADYELRVAKRDAGKKIEAHVRPFRAAS